MILERWTDQKALDAHARPAPPPFKPELCAANAERETYAYNRMRQSGYSNSKFQDLTLSPS